MKNLTTFEHFNYEEETDLYALVEFVGQAELLTPEFVEEFESLWAPEQMTDQPVWKVFVFDIEGFEQLNNFLTKELGATSFRSKIV